MRRPLGPEDPEAGLVFIMFLVILGVMWGYTCGLLKWGYES